MAFDLTKQSKSGIKGFDLGKRTTKYVAPERVIVPELKKVALGTFVLSILIWISFLY